MAVFINGLHERIKLELLGDPPETMRVALDRAEWIEAKLLGLDNLGPLSKISPTARSMPQGGFSQAGPDSRPKGWVTHSIAGPNREGPWVPGNQTKAQSTNISAQTRSSPQSAISYSGPAKSSTATSTVAPPKFRRLTEAEAQVRRSKGLCYRCDEKYFNGHRCKVRELQVMLVDDEPSDDVASPEPEESAEGVDLAVLELSTQAVEGYPGPRTIKVRGQVNGVDVAILIDCGASHNFVSDDLVAFLQLPVSPTHQYGVVVGDGHQVRRTGVCKDLKVQFQGITVSDDFFPMSLPNSDVLLGMQWLYSLGVTTTDWPNLTLTFTSEGKDYSVQGDPNLHRALISCRSFQRSYEKAVGCFLIELYQFSTTVATPDLSSLDPSIQSVLFSFSELFQVPTALPPPRAFDHAIVLQEGTDPVESAPTAIRTSKRRKSRRWCPRCFRQG
ncbi:hypothetical protein Scep_022104 [Stephania cephalantha]|uniref:Gag-pol polyprotein n=1 Tax=Stephania cephalantha TaxID=152367 RepID=A0AAP0F7B0_9MAGN